MCRKHSVSSRPQRAPERSLAAEIADALPCELKERIFEQITQHRAVHIRTPQPPKSEVSAPTGKRTRSVRSPKAPSSDIFDTSFDVANRTMALYPFQEIV